MPIRKEKTERAKRKRQEGKVGVAEKSDYLALDWGRETSLKNHLTSLKENLENEKHAREKAGGREGLYVHVCVCVHVCV